MPGWGPAPKSLWRPLGPPGSARGTVAAGACGGRLFLARDDGALRAVEPRSGRAVTVATQGHAGVEALHGAGSALIAVEKQGRVSAVDPETGATKAVGQIPAPTRYPASTVLDGALYVISAEGQLFKLGLTGGAAAPVGRPEFEEVAELFGVGGRLLALDVDGGLHDVDPTTGAATLLKRGSGEALAAAVSGSALFTFTEAGLLLRTQLPGGDTRQLGGADYAGTRLAVAVDGALITIEADGTLYRVEVR